MSSHSLMIEKVRHSKNPLQRADRKCPFCKDQIEDECHFLITCPLYIDDRRDFFNSIRSSAPLFDEIPTALQKYIFIHTNEDNTVMNEQTRCLLSFCINTSF